MLERNSPADACCSGELNTYGSCGAQDETADYTLLPDSVAHNVDHDVLDVDRRIGIDRFPCPCWTDTSDSHHASLDRHSTSQDYHEDFALAWSEWMKHSR